MEPSLIVGRDRAHVRELLKTPRLAEVISASAFFDKVRALAFIYHPELRRDDNAPLVVVQDILARTGSFPLSYARNFVTLYSSLYHGTKTPLEVYQAIVTEKPVYLPVIEHVAWMDEKLVERNLVNGVGALFRAWRIIEERRVIPLALKHESIALCHLIDLTALETEVIKFLAQLGLSIQVTLPIDLEKRAFNLPIDYAARPFEAQAEHSTLTLAFEPLQQKGPLKAITNGFLSGEVKLHFAEDQCSVTVAADLVREADACAERVAQLKAQSPTDSIAVVVRSMDERSKIFKHALIAHGISVKDRKGIPVLETPAGIFLGTLFSLCSSSMARSDVISAITHPCSVFRLDGPARASVIALFDELGCDDHILRPFSLECRYQSLFARARVIWQDNPEKQELLDVTIALIETIKTLIRAIPARATLAHYLSIALRLIEQGFRNDKKPDAIIETLTQLQKSAQMLSEQVDIEFQDFKALLIQELSSLTEAYPDADDIYAVEFLMLPELLGRSFDHVLIADISFGRMPQAISADPIFRDEHRVHLNKLMKKEVLRIYFDDPFEPLPVPPRQALEPFWFMGALAAAEKSIHFSCAQRDHQAKEQAESEFFLWLREHLVTSLKDAPTRYVTNQEKRFFEGKVARKNGDFHDWLHAEQQRCAMFTHQQSGPFAGQLSPELVEELFAGRLGNNPDKALTPTMVEAFSQCRFSGLFNRILNVSVKEALHDELDHRALGAIAHKVLELYYQRKTSDLKALVREVSETYQQTHFVVYPDVFFCQMEWLFHLLERLIISLDRAFTGSPMAFEMAFGLGQKWPGVLIGDEQKYLLGGVIDRIDSAGSKIAVIDYKLSSIAQLKANAASQLVTNFQIPIYMRLVASWLKESSYEINFYYASLRDGEIIQVSDCSKADTSEESLLDALNTIFKPVQKGNMSAIISERCTTCDLGRICRHESRV